MIREKCCLSQMSKNGDVERAFHVEGTAYAEEQMQKREKQSQVRCSCLERQLQDNCPAVPPSNQNTPSQSFLNGNSGAPTACRIEHI